MVPRPQENVQGVAVDWIFSSRIKFVGLFWETYILVVGGSRAVLDILERHWEGLWASKLS